MSRLDDAAEAVVFAHEAEREPFAPYSLEERSLERVAALAAGALNRPCPAPPALSSRLAAEALRFCAEERSAHRVEPPGFTTPRPQSSRGLVAFFLGAAAAGLTLWLAGVAATPAEPSQSALRAATIASDTGQRADWKRGPSPLSGEVRGDVVWRQQQQDGWLTFRDLPALPGDRCYQLWIVDSTRAGAPVDGGVFSVASAADETFVTIQPKLSIGSPSAFVVTVEERGGVVVSDQEHVVAIASL